MPSYAFFQKQFVPLAEARIGIMTHALHYGTAVFEGIRGNWNSQQKQTYLFRLKEHYERLQNGCQVMNIALHYSLDELCRTHRGTGSQVRFSGRYLRASPGL